MIPGQFGPINRLCDLERAVATRTMSSVGIPSVMHTIKGMLAAAASMIASAAKAGGTKIIVAFAPSLSTASLTVLKTGIPSCRVPPFPGVTPATTLVPYATHCFVWKEPSCPVIPCTINRVFLSTRIDTTISPLAGRGYNLFSGIFHPVSHGKLQSGVLQNLLPLLDVGALEPYNHGDFQPNGFRGLHDTVSHGVTAHDAAENIDEDGSHILIGD